MIKFIPAVLVFSFIWSMAGLAHSQAPIRTESPVHPQEQKQIPVRAEKPVQLQVQKEVVIIGSMHTVPKSIGHVYKPLLKSAMEYGPQAIYVERILPEDSLSREFVKTRSEKFKSFYRLSDSLHQTGLSFEPEYIRFLLEMGPAKLAAGEMEDALRYFALEKDFANFEFYKYVQTFGPGGSPEPLGNEYCDLTFPLALHLSIPVLYSMDSRQREQAYYDSYAEAILEGQENGNYEIYKKLSRKDSHATVIAGMTGRMGKQTNRKNVLERMYLLNSFRFAAVSTPATEAAAYYWDLRNEKMAANIARQVMAAPHTRNLVVTGAEQVLSLKKALEKNYPALRVRLILYLGD